MSIGNFPESLTQAMLVGTMLVGGLGVQSRTLCEEFARLARDQAGSKYLKLLAYYYIML